MRDSLWQENTNLGDIDTSMLIPIRAQSVHVDPRSFTKYDGAITWALPHSLACEIQQSGEGGDIRAKCCSTGRERCEAGRYAKSLSYGNDIGGDEKHVQVHGRA